jgi:hypothetical protein
MNAESTVFRSSRPAVVVAPGGDGARLAAWVLSWPMRLAATAMGRRLLAAAALAMVLVAAVGFLYETADPPGAAATFRPAGGVAAGAEAPGAARQAAAAPARAQRSLKPADAAAAWFAASRKLAADKVRALGARRLSPTEIEVLVVAETSGASMPSQYVTVRKGPSGWEVP